MKIEIDDVIADKILIQQLDEAIEGLRRTTNVLVQRKVENLEKWEIQDLHDQLKFQEALEQTYLYFTGCHYTSEKGASL